MSNRERPLSPHLQVYRFKLHMLMSALHRLTGLFLGVGAFLLAWWATALSTSDTYYEFLIDLLTSGLGRLVLFAITVALVYHAFNGLRHLGWDFGRGFEKSQVKASGILVMILTVVVTVAIWLLAYYQAGAM